jgi:transcriptional regulator GlxA family with amidase domain
LKEDSLLILFAGNTHYGVSPCQAGTKTMYFHVSCEEDDLFGPKGASELFVDTHVDASKNKSIKRLFADVVNAKLSGEQRKANLCFELLLCELTSHKMCFEEKEIAQKIQSVIHGYPERFFSNRELAHMVNVSAKTAETKFKAAFGKTMHQYMLEFKIREAKALFDRFTGISVKEVAYNLGFCDEYHFSKQFSRYTGLSPSSYRKRNERSDGLL